MSKEAEEAHERRVKLVSRWLMLSITAFAVWSGVATLIGVLRGVNEPTPGVAAPDVDSAAEGSSPALTPP
jgi:hypothetical protein